MTNANVERKKKKSKKDQKTPENESYTEVNNYKKMKYTSGNKRVLQKL